MSENEYVDERQQRPARKRRRSRYERPRTYISWTILIIGGILGILNGVNFAWNIAPVEEFDTIPRQLRPEAKAQYAIAIMLEYNHTGDLSAAVQRLSALNLPGDDPIQAVANLACDLASTGYVNSSSGIRGVQALMRFYRAQGRTSCADELLPMEVVEGTTVVQITVPTSTPIIIPSKTPTPVGTPPPTQTPVAPIISSNTSANSFAVVDVRTFCSTDISGVIEVRVWDASGDPYPGQPVRVRWSSGDSVFYTGLKPERGPDYADFQMEAGVEYTIDMPGLSDPYPTPLLARTCATDRGEEAIISYSVVFREN